MGLKTKDAPEDKKTKFLELKAHHLPKFEALEVEDPFFVTSMAYKPIGKTEKFISFFPSQLKKGVDIYTEFTNKDLKPDDVNRTLYRWRFNPHWQEEYESVEIEGSTDCRYLIPVAELTPVVMPKKQDGIIPFESFADIMDPDQDCPIEHMTLRDLAAIMLNKPVSKKAWLNNLIK
jgi:hypothetical protein